MSRTILLVGATGDVGQGIARALVQQDWNVIAAARSAEPLEAFVGSVQSAYLAGCVGDIASEEGATALWTAANEISPVDTVIVSINALSRAHPLAAWSSDDLTAFWNANLVPHFVAAKIFLPRLPASGLFLGIGGGTADFVIPKLGHMSMIQAAQRMMYRSLAMEQPDGAHVRELIVASMVNGASTRDRARPEWLSDDEIGQYVRRLVAAPGKFAGPIVMLKSREQVEQLAESD